MLVNRPTTQQYVLSMFCWDLRLAYPILLHNQVLFEELKLRFVEVIRLKWGVAETKASEYQAKVAAIMSPKSESETSENSNKSPSLIGSIGAISMSSHTDMKDLSSNDEYDTEQRARRTKIETVYTDYSALSASSATQSMHKPAPNILSGLSNSRQKSTTQKQPQKILISDEKLKRPGLK